jgi:hypothetical protein
MPSPACTVKDGAGSPQVTPPFATVTTGNTVTIALADTTGVSTWSITCVYTDETSDAATVTAGLTVNSVAKTATFTGPNVGKSYIFQSKINNGRDTNGDEQDSYTTTFKVAVLTEGGHPVAAANETLEHSATFGWVAIVNRIVRDASEYLSGIINTATVDWTPGGVSTYPVKSTLLPVQTTDATATTLVSYDAPDGRAIDYTASVLGYRPSNGDTYRIDLGVTYKRFGGGAPTIVGSLFTANERADAGAATWDATIDVSSNTVRVRVTGEASATINWSCELRAQERS